MVLYRYLAPCISLLVALTAFSKNYLEVILARGTGGDTFPVFPTFRVLLLLGAVCWILPQLGIIGISERSTNAAFALALVVSLGLQIPASITHCDSGHVFLNGLRHPYYISPCSLSN